MASLTELLQQGTANAWLFIPSAILLGALHGLEPGHSKTMMAAFIIAIQGTVSQAVLLGLSATISHTAVVWTIALAGQYFGRQWGGETSEPYFQLASAVIIVCIALWMIWRTWREQNAEAHEHHHHGNVVEEVQTSAGVLEIEIFEQGMPARWRVTPPSGIALSSDDLEIETVRADGARQVFAFAARDGFFESEQEIPEPHEFKAVFRVKYRVGNVEQHELLFREHDHSHLNLGDEDDAHARAHAADIRKRFAGREVTTAQIVLFGLTGGLIPCPAAITVLLLCIQLKQLSLGLALVLCFGVGLALTMVSAGVLASLSMKHIAKRWDGFSAFAQRAPYASGVLIILVGVFVGVQAWHGIQAGVHEAKLTFPNPAYLALTH
jgi:nickel/cobalt exporter